MALWAFVIFVLCKPVCVFAQQNSVNTLPNINAMSEQLRKALHDHDLKTIKRIFDSDFPIDQPLWQGTSPAIADACFCGCPVAILRFLVARGANVNVRIFDGQTPLMLAAQDAHLDAFRYLISVGANVRAVDAHHKTLLHYAANPWLPNELQDADAKMALLLHLGVPVDARDDEGNTALIIAAERSTVTSLLHAGASVRARDKTGKTALMAAACIGNCRAARQLIACGADGNAWDNEGWTALVHLVYHAQGEHSAFEEGQKCIMRLLYRHHADFNVYHNWVNPILIAGKYNQKGDDDSQGKTTASWVIPMLRKFGAR